MITVAYARKMARYNRWQNVQVYAAAAKLTDDVRRQERGAFFGSIHGTLNHILWGDQQWMSRFADTPRPTVGSIPESVGQHADFTDLERERAAFDAVIIDWADNLDPASLEGDLTWYSGATKSEMSKPKWPLITHMFNHQTHHRGQVHCMLTQCGVDPGATDLGFMPE
jgi:uncharacterized damage-inducible protein DinB